MSEFFKAVSNRAVPYPIEAGYGEIGNRLVTLSSWMP
jgi:hypothetical protein